MKNKITEVLGWYGTIAIVLAYTLVSFSIIQADDLSFQLLNGSGAIGIILVSLHKKAYQPAVLNIIWAIIALVAIVKMFV